MKDMKRISALEARIADLEREVAEIKASLGKPPPLANGPKRFRTDNDAGEVRAFLDACTVSEPNGRVDGARLYGAYCDWCVRAEVMPALSQTAFGRRLGDLGVPKEKYGRVFYLGICLCAEACE